MMYRTSKSIAIPYCVSIVESIPFLMNGSDNMFGYISHLRPSQ